MRIWSTDTIFSIQCPITRNGIITISIFCFDTQVTKSPSNCRPVCRIYIIYASVNNSWSVCIGRMIHILICINNKVRNANFAGNIRIRERRPCNQRTSNHSNNYFFHIFPPILCIFTLFFFWWNKALGTKTIKKAPHTSAGAY